MISIYNHREENHDIKVRDDKVVIKAKASESYGNRNARNVNLDVELSHEQILEAAEQIEEQQ